MDVVHGPLNSPLRSFELPVDIEQLRVLSETADASTFQRGFTESQQTCPGRSMSEYAPLLAASVRAHQLELSTFLLSQGVPLTSLHIEIAVKLRLYDVLEAFLHYGWDINQPLGRWRPPPLALALDNEVMIRWFLDHGALPNQKNELNLTAMTAAAQYAPFTAFKLLLNHTTDLKQGDLLHSAIRRTLPDRFLIIESLLDHGVPINERVYQNSPERQREHFFMDLGCPLHTAVEEGLLEVVDLLLQRGADPTIKSSKGFTALDIAERMGYTEIARVLRNR